MKNWRGTLLLIFISVLAVTKIEAVQGPPNLIRVCHDNTGNSLIWSNPDDVCGTFSRNIVYHKHPASNEFVPIDTIEDHQISEYIHSNGHTTSSEYYLRIEDDCAGTGFYNSDTLTADHEAPEPVSIDSISYFEGAWIMGWSPTDPDIMGYVVYIVENGNTRVIDSILGRGNSSYVISEDSEYGRDEFRVAAFDSCMNISPISIPHQNSFLSESIDECSGEITLNWPLYEGWEDGVDSHAVLISEDGPEGEYSTYSKDEMGDGTYIVESLADDQEFCFKVRSFKSNDPSITSATNPVCVTTNFVRSPSELYLQTATVDNGAINIEWEVSGDGDISHFELMKSRDTMHFPERFTIDYNEGETSYSYRDINVNPSDTEYYYQVRVVDICDEVRDTSNLGSNILLTGERTDDFNVLVWTEYVEWPPGISQYTLERTLTIEQPYIWDDIAVLSGDQLIYEDDESFEEVGNEGICYRITAFQRGNDPFGSRNRSQSNIYCIVEEPRVFIPNAFNPMGVNTIFRPDGQFINYEQSSMQIYNRWGSLIYETDDVQKGWDGTEDGSEDLLPAGAYTYIIEIYGLNETLSIHKGQVHLIY